MDTTAARFGVFLLALLIRGARCVRRVPLGVKRGEVLLETAILLILGLRERRLGLEALRLIALLLKYRLNKVGRKIQLLRKILLRFAIRIHRGGLYVWHTVCLAWELREGLDAVWGNILISLVLHLVPR